MIPYADNDIWARLRRQGCSPDYKLVYLNSRPHQWGSIINGYTVHSAAVHITATVDARRRILQIATDVMKRRYTSLKVRGCRLYYQCHENELDWHISDGNEWFASGPLPSFTKSTHLRRKRERCLTAEMPSSLSDKIKPDPLTLTLGFAFDDFHYRLRSCCSISLLLTLFNASYCTAIVVSQSKIVKKPEWSTSRSLPSKN